MDVVGYELGESLRNWKCKDFKLTIDALYELPIREKIRVWWGAQAWIGFN